MVFIFFFQLLIVKVWATTSYEVNVLLDNFARFEISPPDESSDLKIMGPTNVQRETHIGIDPQTGGFQVENLPPEWVKLFKKAGISKKEARDPEVARLVLEILAQHTPGQQQKKRVVAKTPSKKKTSPVSPATSTTKSEDVAPLPTRKAPAVPEGALALGAPAPPPPPPAATPGAPAPPPPAEKQQQGTPSAPQGDLMAQIKGGKAIQLKKVGKRDDKKPAAGGAVDLMAEIRAKKSLRKVTEEEKHKEKPVDTHGDLMASIRGGASHLKKVNIFDVICQMIDSRLNLF